MADFSQINPGSPAGYLIAFTFPLLDAFFPVVPSEAVVIAIGVLASKRFDVRIALLLVLVAMGAFCGDNISYWLGSRYGTRVAGRLLRGERGRRSMSWAQRTLRRYGARLLIVARFVPGGRTAVTLTAGLTSYPVRRFRAAVAVAAVLWTSYAFGIGALGARTFADNSLAALGFAFGVAVAISILIEIGRRVAGRLSKRRARRTATSGTPGR
jgi:membrane protein DedA with SNARE-associated domain